MAAYSTFKRAIVAIRTTMGRRMQRLGGISLAQFEILLVLEQTPQGMRMHEVAETVGVSRSGLTYQIGQMEKLGWVQRVSDPENSRAVVATLTDAGKERVTGLQEHHFQLVRERIFGLLDESELKLVTSIMQRIAASASQEMDNLN